MKRVWLEAGGKSANLVFADCPDLQKAASATAASSTTRARCASPERVC
ncbi:aldehyde dehydrogenase family protein [Escherichia coli]